MDDRTAIERCRKGDTEAFRHIVEQYQSQALGHAAAILGNRDDAMDAVQEAFIDAFQSLEVRPRPEIRANSNYYFRQIHHLRRWRN